MTELEKSKLEFEQVTIKVPKPIMDFLRKTDTDNEGPESWIAHQIVDAVRAYLDIVDPADLADWFNLTNSFREVLERPNKTPTPKVIP